MAVSNPPTLTSVIAEFGSSGSPANLYAYRRGGGIIPDTSDYSVVGDGVSTEVKLSQFAGLSAINHWLATINYPGATSSVGGLTDSVAMDSSGNIYIVGRIPSPTTLIVMKISKTGSVVWAKNTVDPSPTSALVYNFVNNRSSINVDVNGNVYVATTVTKFSGGSYDGGIYAMKLNTDGTMLWSRYITGGVGNDFHENSCIDSSGNLYITGGTSQEAPSGYLQAYDTYTIKLDTNGNSIWQTTHRTGDENYHTSCWTDGTYLYCTGEYNWYGGAQLIKYSCANGSIVSNWYYVNSRSGYGTGITGDNQGYVYIQGACSDPSFYYPFVAKIEASTGNIIWQTWFDTTGSGPEVTSLKYDPSTGYVFVDVESGALTCMNSANGTIIWQRSYEGKMSFDVNSSALVLNGGYWVQPQYALGSGIWRAARIPKDGSKTGTYYTSPSGYAVNYAVASTPVWTPLNQNVTRRNGGGTYVSRAFSSTGTEVVLTNTATSAFEKAII